MLLADLMGVKMGSAATAQQYRSKLSQGLLSLKVGDWFEGRRLEGRSFDVLHEQLMTLWASPKSRLKRRYDGPAHEE